MTRNRALIIIGIILLLIIGFGVWYYYSLYHGGFGGTQSAGELGGIAFPSSSQTTGSVTGNQAVLNATASPQFLADVPPIRHITTVPVAGADFEDRSYAYSATTSNGKIIKVPYTRTIIHYVQRSNAYVYETATDTLLTTRIANTTIPKIYQAYFVGTGDSILMRYLADDNETIETVLSTLTPKQVASSSVTTSTSSTATSTTSTATTTLSIPVISPTSPNATAPASTTAILSADVDTDDLQGKFLSENINSFAISPDKNQLFYLVDSQSGSTGLVTNLFTSKVTQIFSSPFKEWTLDWPSTSTYILTTNADGNAAGFAYTLDPSTNILSKIVGPLPGLTTLTNPTGTKVLYSQAANNSITTNIYSLQDGTSIPLNIKTLPEKCVWSKLNTDLLYCMVPNDLSIASYPDSWYKGLTAFTDSLWSINTATGETKDIANFDTAVKTAIDGTDLKLDSSEDTLLFTNKRDLTLWSIKL